MQILIIILVVTLFLFDENTLPDWVVRMQVDWPVWERAVVSILDMTILISVLFIIQSIVRRRLERLGRWKYIVIADRVSSYAMIVIVLVHVINIALLGWLEIVRGVTGNLVLVDELIALLPALLAVVAVWISRYPVARMVREASLIGRLDRGEPIYPVWTRWQFVLSQIRLHFVLILLPVLLVIGWRELIEIIADGDSFLAPFFTGDISQLIALMFGTAVIFLFTPVMVRRLWDTHPLPHGELRSRLLEMCRTHHIRIRELLVWNTFGSMINGAVMGLVGRLRYILLTDALLDALTPLQVEAVMAHELGHIRRKHLPALILAILALLTITGMGITAGVSIFESEANPQRSSISQVDQEWSNIRDWYAQVTGGNLLDVVPPEQMMNTDYSDQFEWVDSMILMTSLVFTLLIFGWVSRRFERQADTFAVQHLSGISQNQENDPSIHGGRITVDACAVMIRTLGIVAELNHISPTRRSWRHGSIAWRQRYLNSLIGKRADHLPIDRQIFIIKLVSLLVVVFSFSYFLWSEW